jgi:HSP20 family protein
MTHNTYFSTPSFLNVIKPIFDEVVNEVNKHDNGTQRPQANIAENDSAYMIHLLVPGHTKETVKIELKENLLTISSEGPLSNDTKYNRKEFSIGKIQRSFNLPSKANKDEISATFKEGILQITIGKNAESVAKSVEIL